MEIKTSEAILDNPSKIVKTIATFWNRTSTSWFNIWGPHIHHGYFDDAELSFRDAQEKLLDKLTAELTINDQDKILDVGCGLGGSSVHLVEKFGANVTGISLSSTQIELACKYAEVHHVNQSIKFILDDAHLLSNFNNNYFDIVWSLESCEQFYDKQLFIKQAERVLRPGGQLMLATWCSGAETYNNEKAKIYKKLCHIYDLPYLPTLDWYRNILLQANFQVNKIFDWSSYVEKSCDAITQIANSYSIFKLIKIGGLRGFKALRQAKLMREAYNQKLMRYGVFIATKL